MAVERFRKGLSDFLGRKAEMLSQVREQKERRGDFEGADVLTREIREIYAQLRVITGIGESAQKKFQEAGVSDPEVPLEVLFEAKPEAAPVPEEEVPEVPEVRRLAEPPVEKGVPAPTLVFNKEENTLTIGKRVFSLGKLGLGPKTTRLFEVLSEHRETPLPTKKLLKIEPELGTEKKIRSLVNHFRGNFEINPKEPELLVTIPNRGYLLRPEFKIVPPPEEVVEKPAPERKPAWSLDPEKGTFTFGNVTIHRRRASQWFSIIEYLTSRPGEFITSTRQLIAGIEGVPVKTISPEKRSHYTSAIRRLREKIEENPDKPKILVFEKGKGYALMPPEAAEEPESKEKEVKLHLFNPEERILVIGDKVVKLSKLQNLLVGLLTEAEGEVVPFGKIKEVFRSPQDSALSLRKKLAEVDPEYRQFLATIKNKGYKWDNPIKITKKSLAPKPERKTPRRVLSIPKAASLTGLSEHSIGRWCKEPALMEEGEDFVIRGNQRRITEKGIARLRFFARIKGGRRGVKVTTLKRELVAELSRQQEAKKKTRPRRMSPSRFKMGHISRLSSHLTERAEDLEGLSGIKIPEEDLKELCEVLYKKIGLNLKGKFERIDQDLKLALEAMATRPETWEKSPNTESCLPVQVVLEQLSKLDEEGKEKLIKILTTPREMTWITDREGYLIEVERS